MATTFSPVPASPCRVTFFCGTAGSRTLSGTRNGAQNPFRIGRTLESRIGGQRRLQCTPCLDVVPDLGVSEAEMVLVLGIGRLFARALLKRANGQLPETF